MWLILLEACAQQHRIMQREKATRRQRWKMVEKFLETGSYYAVEKALGNPLAQVKYWVRKYLDPLFHCKPLGGAKKSTFAHYELAFVNKEVRVLS
jgi:hypothetical protein